MIFRSDIWVDVPNDGDLLESRTMAKVMWVLSGGGRLLTQVYDRTTCAVRNSIVIPLFPIARWIVDNWHDLLNESWSFEGPIPGPGEPRPPAVQEWLLRHCMRAATSGYASPFVCFFRRGEQVVIHLRPDPPGRYPHTPVEFLGGFEVEGDPKALRAALAGIVWDVLARLQWLEDARVVALQVDWQALQPEGQRNE